MAFGGDDRQRRRHGLHGRDGLQFGDRRHREHRGARVGLAQFLVGHVAGEGDAVGDAELLGERAAGCCSWSPPPTISSLASSSAGSSAIAFRSTSICFSPVTRPTNRMRFSVRGGEVGRVVVGVDAARDRVDAAESGELLEELGGLARRRRHGFGAPEGAARGLPGQPDGPLLDALRQQRELEHVLGHEVVGADDADAALLAPRSTGRAPRRCATGSARRPASPRR